MGPGDRPDHRHLPLVLLSVFVPTAFIPRAITGQALHAVRRGRLSVAMVDFGDQRAPRLSRPALCSLILRHRQEAPRRHGLAAERHRQEARGRPIVRVGDPRSARARASSPCCWSASSSPAPAGLNSNRALGLPARRGPGRLSWPRCKLPDAAFDQPHPGGASSKGRGP